MGIKSMAYIGVMADASPIGKCDIVKVRSVELELALQVGCRGEMYLSPPVSKQVVETS